ncbi:MAG: transporter substrate-binding protein, partial [Chloroflexi bacterium]|nr:transporter substrate-binding protein [Chloroflexota bacterium]
MDAFDPVDRCKGGAAAPISRRGLLRSASILAAAAVASGLLSACGASELPGPGSAPATAVPSPPRPTGAASAAGPTAAASAMPTARAAAAPAGAGGTIPVGILHSLSGTMAISEVAVKNAELMAIDEINAKGGVLGKKIEPIVEDGASDWPTFAEKAKLLLQDKKVAAIFGCWTSASRKAVLPVVQQLNGLLYYPVQYEGLEQSPNIFYICAPPNQQIIPAVSYLLAQKRTRFYLLGSDYVFPRTANKIIKAQLAAEHGTVVGEDYTPLGHTDYTATISKIKAANPDVVFNTLNGDSNVAFFKQLADAGITAEQLPTLSVSIAEVEVKGIGAKNMVGHLTAWNYFQSLDTPANAAFVA